MVNISGTKLIKALDNIKLSYNNAPLREFNSGQRYINNLHDRGNSLPINPFFCTTNKQLYIFQLRDLRHKLRILTSLGYIFKVFRLWSVLIFSILRINLVPWLVISKLLFSVSSIIIGQITQNNAKCRHCANRRLICVAHPHQKLFAVCWANEEIQFTVSENSTCSLKICIIYIDSWSKRLLTLRRTTESGLGGGCNPP